MPRAPQSLKARALGLIAQREHSPVELRRKLRAQAMRQRRAAERTPLASQAADTDADEAATATTGVTVPTAQELDELLDWLVAKDLLNTARFVEARVNLRAQRHGNLRIRHELAQHGVEIDPDKAAALERSELARAQSVWSKRFGERAADAAGRAKQMRFLAARGFSADVVRRVVAGHE